MKTTKNQNTLGRKNLVGNLKLIKEHDLIKLYLFAHCGINIDSHENENFVIAVRGLEVLISEIKKNNLNINTAENIGGFKIIN